MDGQIINTDSTWSEGGTSVPPFFWKKMNLYKQKIKLNALGIRMITWADRTKVPISNQQNHI